jgi:hypothetical protein
VTRISTHEVKIETYDAGQYTKAVGSYTATSHAFPDGPDGSHEFRMEFTYRDAIGSLHTAKLWLVSYHHFGFFDYSDVVPHPNVGWGWHSFFFANGGTDRP